MINKIVLTEDQARVLSASDASVEVVLPNGDPAGLLDPREASIIAEAKRRLAQPGPRYSSAAVFAMLDALETERARVGPFDVDYAMAFVDELERKDPDTYGPGVRSSITR